MRYVFSRKIPSSSRILLIESGRRGTLEEFLPIIPRAFGEVEVDIVTCFAGAPKGHSGVIFNINEYGGPAGRGRLFADLAARDYQIAGLLSTGDPIMTKWKWWLAYKLPAKIFVVNENSDIFWCDSLKTVRMIALQSAGVYGSSVLLLLIRLALLPFTVFFLITYAIAVHLRRRLRRL